MTAEAQPGPRRRGLWLGLALGVALLVVVVRLTLGGDENEPPAALPPSAPAVSTTATVLPERDEAPVLPIGAGGSMTAEMTLPPPLLASDGESRRFTVRVADELGRAVRGAQVRVWTDAADHPQYLPPPETREAFVANYAARGSAPWGETHWGKLSWSDPTWGTPSDIGETDESGRARLSARPGTVAIDASSDGVGRSLVWTGEAGTDVSLELGTPRTTTGVVLSASGEPVAGATVHSSPELKPGAVLRAHRPLPTLTDAQGRFTLEVDGTSPLRAWALADGRWSAGRYARQGLALGSDFELRFYGRFSIQGRVLRPDGAPAASASVSARTQGEYLSVTAGSDGRFRLPVAQPGRWTLGGSTNDAISDTVVAITLDDRAPTADVVIPLVATSSISGRARWESGEPATGFSIEVMPAFRQAGGSMDFLQSWRPGPSVECDVEGRFVVSGLAPSGTFELKATRGGDAAESKPVEAPAGAQDVELIVDPASAGRADLSGRVVADLTGEPITTFEYRLSGYSFITELFTEANERVESKEGRFILPDLPRKPHWLQFRAEGYPPKTVGPVTPGETIEVRLDHLATLVVSVVDETGAASPGARVRLRPSRMNPLTLTRPPDERTTDVGGQLVWADLLPEAHSIQATDGQLFSETLDLDLGATSPLEVTLKLDAERAAGQLVVRTRHADGRPYAGVRLSATTFDGGMPCSGTTDALGEVRFGPLSAGAYMVMPLEHAVFQPGTARVNAGETTTFELDAEE